MATDGHDKSTAMRYSETTGSEVVFDHTCTPCVEESVKEAVGFCVNCNEWLCDECFRHHKRPKPTRFHVLMSSEEMKQSSFTRMMDDQCTEKCDEHVSKRLKYFCPAHDIFGCSFCIIQRHRMCDVQYIPDISTAVETKAEFQEVTAMLQAVAKVSKEIWTEVHDKMKINKTKHTEVVNSFHQYRKGLAKTLDNIEVALEEQCEMKEAEETLKLKHI